MIEPLGERFDRELRRAGFDGSMAAIVACWPHAVGEAVARNAWPARLARDRTLVVATASSTWAFELSQLAATVLERLREALGETAPAALRFVPGQVPEPAPPAPLAAPARPRPVDPEAAALAARLARTIDDEALRELVARAAALSLSRGGSGRRS